MFFARRCSLVRLAREERRWKSVIWCICQDINIFFLFCNGSSYATFSFPARFEQTKNCCERKISSNISCSLALLQFSKMMLFVSSVMASEVYLKVNFNFRPMLGGSTECDLKDGGGWMCDKKFFFFRREMQKICFQSGEREVRQLCRQLSLPIEIDFPQSSFPFCLTSPTWITDEMQGTQHSRVHKFTIPIPLHTFSRRLSHRNSTRKTNYEP